MFVKIKEFGARYSISIVYKRHKSIRDAVPSHLAQQHPMLDSRPHQAWKTMHHISEYSQPNHSLLRK